jgi:hypothetical protein
VITANVNTDYDIMSIEIDGYIDEEAYFFNYLTIRSGVRFFVVLRCILSFCFSWETWEIRLNYTSSRILKNL